MQRILAAGLAGMLTSAAMLAVALMSEYRADAGTVTPPVRINDVARALREQRLVVSSTGMLVVHSRLGVAGDELRVDGEPVVVYIFPSVAERAAAEQLIRAPFLTLLDDRHAGSSEQRAVAARSVLLVHAVSDRDRAATIYRAAGELARP